MKKNTNPATKSDLKNVENNASNQQKVSEGQPDSSILADKHPVKPENKKDRPYKEQDEFIDRNSNSKKQD